MRSSEVDIFIADHIGSSTFVGVAVIGAVTANFVYDGDGQRAWVSVGQAVTTHIGNYFNGRRR